MNNIKFKYFKNIINDKDYSLKRIDLIETKIYQWKSYYNKATTSIEKECCKKMINMYLKRLMYYINK